MMVLNTMNARRTAARALVTGTVLFAALGFALPQAAEAQFGTYREDRPGNRYGQQGRYDQDRYGQGRNNRQRRNNRADDRYTYGSVRFDWDTNGFNVRDRNALETQIRRLLNDDAGSRYVGRRSGSSGTLDVNVAFRRLNRDTVQADVRLGLNRDGRGVSAVTATESATTLSRDRNVDSDFILRAFRSARREFTQRVNEYSRDDRSNGNNRNDRYDRYDRYDRDDR